MTEPLIQPNPLLSLLYDNQERLKQTETKETALIGAGTAFPVAPAIGRVFFRTDLDWWCYWDGTRWLTVHEYAMVLSAFVSYGTASPQTTNLQNVRFDYAPYITRVTFHYRVSTTNNGTNFWDMTIQGINGAISASDSIAATSSGAVAAGTIVRVDGAAAIPNPTNRDWFRVQISKTLTPGAIEMAAQMNYRLVVP